jgi:hypothetical protein
MSKTDMMAIRNMGACAELTAGKAATAVIMAGSQSLTALSGKAAITSWVRSAMERMEGTLPKAKRTGIMRSCGHACAARHSSVAEGARRRLQTAASLDEFLAAETRRFGGGVRYERRGELIIHTYEPGSYKRPMRCYCGLTKGLKPTEALPVTFCECSAGFVEATWEAILGKPVTVKLLESAVSGSSVCRFEVKPRGGAKGTKARKA